MPQTTHDTNDFPQPGDRTPEAIPFAEWTGKPAPSAPTAIFVIGVRDVDQPPVIQQLREMYGINLHVEFWGRTVEAEAYLSRVSERAELRVEIATRKLVEAIKRKRDDAQVTAEVAADRRQADGHLENIGRRDAFNDVLALISAAKTEAGTMPDPEPESKAGLLAQADVRALLDAATEAITMLDGTVPVFVSHQAMATRLKLEAGVWSSFTLGMLAALHGASSETKAKEFETAPNRAAYARGYKSATSALVATQRAAELAPKWEGTDAALQHICDAMLCADWRNIGELHAAIVPALRAELNLAAGLRNSAMAGQQRGDKALALAYQHMLAMPSSEHRDEAIDSLSEACTVFAPGMLEREADARMRASNAPFAITKGQEWKNEDGTTHTIYERCGHWDGWRLDSDGGWEVSDDYLREHFTLQQPKAPAPVGQDVEQMKDRIRAAYEIYVNGYIPRVCATAANGKPHGFQLAQRAFKQMVADSEIECAAHNLSSLLSTEQQRAAKSKRAASGHGVPAPVPDDAFLMNEAARGSMATMKGATIERMRLRLVDAFTLFRVWRTEALLDHIASNNVLRREMAQAVYAAMVADGCIIVNGDDSTYKPAYYGISRSGADGRPICSQCHAVLHVPTDTPLDRPGPLTCKRCNRFYTEVTEHWLARVGNAVAALQVESMRGMFRGT